MKAGSRYAITDNINDPSFSLNYSVNETVWHNIGFKDFNITTSTLSLEISPSWLPYNESNTFGGTAYVFSLTNTLNYSVNLTPILLNLPASDMFLYNIMYKGKSASSNMGTYEVVYSLNGTQYAVDEVLNGATMNYTIPHNATYVGAAALGGLPFNSTLVVPTLATVGINFANGHDGIAPVNASLSLPDALVQGNLISLQYGYANITI